MAKLKSLADVKKAVRKAVRSAPIFDMHTHLYDPAFGDLLLYGIDELLQYHYCRAELFRLRPELTYDEYWNVDPAGRAELVWDAFFERNTPISESARGVVTTLVGLGLEPRKGGLAKVREYYNGKSSAELVDTVFEQTKITQVVMTNDPFDPAERPYWETPPTRDARFLAALRIDPLLVGWPESAAALREQGYNATDELSDETLAEIRRFLLDWAERMDPLYLACSLPPSWRYPDESPASTILRECVLPVCRQINRPMALMIGVRRGVNPALKEGGDAVGIADVQSLAILCQEHPDNKFLVTMLSRENQHELTVLSRKFKNLLLFGCWWFMIIPELMDEVTRMRLDMLGLGFVPQHSDARVLEQVLYKWSHSKRIIGKALEDRYVDTARAGWTPTEAEITRDIHKLFDGSLLMDFIGK